MFSVSDGIWVGLLVMFGIVLMNIDFPNELGSPKVLWVNDARNGCVPRDTVPLANDGEIKQSNFVPKFLTVYDCKNGLTAALIEKQ